MGKIISPHRRPVFTAEGDDGSGISFATWDEKTQAGWTGITVADNVIWMFDGTGAGDDQIATGGGLSEANRTIADFGAVAGATGDPLRRKIELADGFTLLSNTTLAFLHGLSTYTIIYCYKANSMFSGNPALCDMSADHRISIQWYSNNYDVSVGPENQAWNQAGSPLQDTGNVGSIYHICIWQASGTLRFGFGVDIGRTPANSSDLTHNDFDSPVTLDENGALARDEIIGNSGHAAAFQVDMQYILWSKENLINNDD